MMVSLLKMVVWVTVHASLVASFAQLRDRRRFARGGHRQKQAEGDSFHSALE
jgi:hypothetical protein